MLRNFVILLALSGCGQFPDIADTLLPEAQAAAFPRPTNVLPILAAAAQSAEKTDRIEAATDAQIARANALGTR